LGSERTVTVKDHQRLVTESIEPCRNELTDLSLGIHAHPGTNYEERFGAKTLTDVLDRHGFSVDRGIGGVETAFRATIQGRTNRRSDRGVARIV
jgi:metal-dependent amidase/aminoacylase/carboxypeptidase family protein